MPPLTQVIKTITKRERVLVFENGNPRNKRSGYITGLSEELAIKTEKSLENQNHNRKVGRLMHLW